VKLQPELAFLVDAVVVDLDFVGEVGVGATRVQPGYGKAGTGDESEDPSRGRHVHGTPMRGWRHVRTQSIVRSTGAPL
jgi:hypothetical protein